MTLQDIVDRLTGELDDQWHIEAVAEGDVVVACRVWNDATASLIYVLKTRLSYGWRQHWTGRVLTSWPPEGQVAMASEVFRIIGSPPSTAI